MTHSQSIDTAVIHAGEEEARVDSAVHQPIFQTAMYLDDDGPIRYIRLNNTPNQKLLSTKLAAIGGGESAIVGSSGMALITGLLLTNLRSGDHVLAQDSLYGGTYYFLASFLKDFGIEVTFVNGNDPETWEAQVRPETRVFYFESITNPLIEVGDLEAVVQFCRDRNLISMIDNTFATPYNYRAAEQGFDLSIHSATKYLNGHSDIVAGAAIGRKDLLDQCYFRMAKLGGSLDPNSCFLLNRGMQTLALRIRAQNANALALAKFLENHPGVSRVNYPGLPSHPDHDRAKRLFRGFGGMLSMELSGGQEAAERLIDQLKIPLPAPSLGGLESLITRPAVSSHASISAEERAKIGITDSLVRISVGAEAIEDLLQDFDQALS